MPDCGSQCWFCDLPVRFDTYEGCSHGCKYCFVQRKNDIAVIKPKESVVALQRFLSGQKSKVVSWCDWAIPLHWGGVSDPFQPCEKSMKRTLPCLKLLADEQYPTIISTKGRLCIEEPYLSLIEKGNIVMQVSAVCSKYDALEPGAPTFEERLKIIGTLAAKAKRVNVRIQPYVHDVFEDVMANIPRFKAAGAHGLIFEGMKFIKKKPGLVRCGSDWVQPKALLRADFEKLREECHRNGLVFYAGENRLRAMGDSLTCCGVEDLDGFKPNTYNICHMVNGDMTEPTEAMTKPGSAECFKAIMQTTEGSRLCGRESFASMQKLFLQQKREYVRDVLGLNER